MSGVPSPSSVPVQRLFIAVTLPPPVRDVIAELPRNLHGLNWTRPEQWHVTLRFLGDVAEDKIETLRQRLRPVRVEPFILPLEGVGSFPPNRPPRVIWVGTGSGHPRLFQLRQRIDDAVLAAGIDLDVRTFHPHVTLARCAEAPGPGLAQWLQAYRDFTAPPVRVEAFDLYRSELHPSGPVHTRLERFPLTDAS